MNQEGYKDETAEKAIREYNRMSYEMKRAVNSLQNIASMLGFEIITIRDKKTRGEFHLHAGRKTNQPKEI